MPDVSVIVVSYNTRELTLACLRALADDLAGTSRDVAADVWVVDNGSADDSAASVAAAFPDARVIAVGRNAGFAAANNLAIGRSAGEFVLLLNSDAFVRPGAVAALVRYLRANPAAALVGPRLVNADGSLQPSCYRRPGPGRAVCEHLLLTAAFPDNRLVGDYRRWPHDRERDVDVVVGACCLVRRAAIDRVGGLDEAFFFYGEDLDWCTRFRKAGWRVAFTPAAEVVHFGGASGKAQPERVFREFQSAVDRFHRKHYGWLGWAVFRAAQGVGAAVRIVTFGAVAAVRPAARPAMIERVRLWRRILLWTLGRGRAAGDAPRAGAAT